MLTIESAIDKLYPKHPFDTIPYQTNYQSLMENYLAMSQAFPYLQAGSQKDIFLPYMENNIDVPEHVELTTIIGNFLCWDETGGLNLTLASGMKGLPRLLETKRFHANLLKKDCVTLFGTPIKPSYTSITKTYLLNLYNGLSAQCPLTRVAHMVAFEVHAHKMIDSLWGSLALKFNLEKNKLAYFSTHVGGDDPAEPYHVAMTNALIDKIVPNEKQALFTEQLLSAYQCNLQWCADIILLSCNPELIAV